METKDTLSSCSYSDEQDMQQMLKQAKILKGGCLNGLSALKSNFTRILEQGITKSEFERAFSHIFGEDVDTFTRTFSQNMDTLEQQLTKETILESNCQNAFRVLKTQFKKIFRSVLIKPSSLDDYMLKTIIHEQTIQKRLDDKKLQIQECPVQEVKALDVISKDKAKKSCMSIDERAQHKREYDSWVNERQIQTTEGKVDSSKAVDASLISDPLSDEEHLVEGTNNAGNQYLAIGQQHTEQPEFNNEGKVDQNAEQCHDTCPLPAKLTDNQTTELLNQSLESENICLKKTVAQFQKDFLRMEAHCVNLELKYQNQALKEGQHGQFLKVTSNEAKVKHDIDVIETINIELEHKVAKLLKENETLKKHYKEMFDSIKTTRAKNIEHTTSLMQIMINSKVSTSGKKGISGLQPRRRKRRKQSVVRQPTALSLNDLDFQSNGLLLPLVDVNNDLSNPYNDVDSQQFRPSPPQRQEIVCWLLKMSLQARSQGQKAVRFYDNSGACPQDKMLFLQQKRQIVHNKG
ncbi:hypothetical protein Tco_0205526 [Tanacetum coccineum]